LKPIAKLSAGQSWRVRKESLKQRKVVDAIRQKILSGEYPAGSRIPIQAELVREFGMSSVTIQRAIHELKRQGFITARRRLGTFITEKPPHLHNYALVFPQDPLLSTVWSNFYEGLRRVGEKINRGDERLISFFYDMLESEQSDDYRRLVELVENHQLSGLIFASPPHRLLDTPLMTEPGIPRVAIAGDPSGLDIPTLSPGGVSLLELAARHLAGRNARRIALFCANGLYLDSWLRGQADFARMGLSTREQWCFMIPALASDTARACARLLMDLPRAERPDGIMVMDDHLTEAVEQGIMNATDPGARKTEIIAVCNFPDRFAHQLPISRVGNDAADILEAAIGIIDAQRAGKKVRRQTFIKAYIEEA